MTRFSVAANFDDDLPELLAPFGAVELFGKLPRDPAGGGRASYMLAPTSRRRLEEHVRRTHQAGLAFNYLVNPACLGNREFTRSGQRAIRKLLDWLSEIGVERLTVSVPYLLELVKASYPHFEVKIGVFADVDTPKKARFFEDLGADCIALQPLIANRDFERLRAVREAVKCDLQLIVNSNCLLECPMTPYHNVGLSHASQTGSGRFFIDYCFLRCLASKLRDPVSYIKSPWIRPEDLYYYEEIGYSSFKILERDAPTAALVRRTQAYCERRFDGNLLDLVQCYGYKEARSTKQPKHARFWELREFLKPWKVDPLRLLPLQKLARLQGMLYERSTGDSLLHMDNRALDGFLDRFTEETCAGRTCDNCSHCPEYARRALRIDPNYRRECLELVHELLGDLASGRMWGRPVSAARRPS